METVVLYIRCVFANKFTLAGYACIIIGLIPKHDSDLRYVADIFQLFGLCLAAVTDFGRETMEKYRAASRFLRKHGEHARLEETYLCRTYCSRRGIALARRDYQRVRLR